MGVVISVRAQNFKIPDYNLQNGRRQSGLLWCLSLKMISVELSLKEEKEEANFAAYSEVIPQLRVKANEIQQTTRTKLIPSSK